MERLLTTPKELHPFYQRMLIELEDNKARELHDMLGVILECARPLTADEVCFALDYEGNRLKTQTAKLRQWDAFDEETRADWRCGWLSDTVEKRKLQCRKRVELTGHGSFTVSGNDVVRVTHATMLDFLLSKLSATLEGKGHELLLSACAPCLTKASLRFRRG